MVDGIVQMWMLWLGKFRPVRLTPFPHGSVVVQVTSSTTWSTWVVVLGLVFRLH